MALRFHLTSKIVLGMLFCISNFLSASSELTCETTSSDFYVLGDFGFIYSRFTNVGQLKLECDVADFLNNSYQLTVDSIEVRFNFFNMKMFNETLELDPFVQLSKLCHFVFFNIHGFDLGVQGPLFRIDQSVQWLQQAHFEFSLTRFKFYYNGWLVDASRCDESIFEQVDIQLFSGMEKLTILWAYNNDLRTPICPYVFKNANIDQLNIGTLRRSPLSSTYPSFLEIRNTNSSAI